MTRKINDVANLLPENGAPYNVDQCDGYIADRRELFAHLADHGIQNTVFLTGDIHSAWACDLPLDAGTYPAESGRSVATELVYVDHRRGRDRRRGPDGRDGVRPRRFSRRV